MLQDSLFSCDCYGNVNAFNLIVGCGLAKVSLPRLVLLEEYLDVLYAVSETVEATTEVFARMHF